MDLVLNKNVATNYKSNPQKIRIMADSWAVKNLYCPKCGLVLKKYQDNKPVADYYCKSCNLDFELKSTSKNVANKIVDGAYDTMIKRLNSDTNPSLFILEYIKEKYIIKNLLLLPKYYFIPNIIEKRKPLSAGARRAYWIGCNIVVKDIPNTAKINYIQNGCLINKLDVVNNWSKISFMKSVDNKNAKGWLLEIMKIIDQIDVDTFTLEELYKFEKYLKIKYPNNNFIKDKIRQQLQILRDVGYLEFIDRGRYRLT